MKEFIKKPWVIVLLACLLVIGCLLLTLPQGSSEPTTPPTPENTDSKPTESTTPSAPTDPTEPSQPTTPTEPPATEPPATEPPATEPPATDPPATEPPATEPPATEPPATEPPATEPPATEPPETEPPETEPENTQIPMPQNQLNVALQQLEYAMLPFGTIVSDPDKDGSAELVNNQTCLIYDIGAGRRLTYYFHQSATEVYTDSAGNIYICYDLYGSNFDEELGESFEGYTASYYAYTGSHWECVLESGWSQYQIYTWDAASEEWIPGAITESYYYEINGQSVTKVEYEAHLESIGFKSVKDTEEERLRLSFDAKYTDSLLFALETELGTVYSLSVLRRDIDSDGQEEIIFAAADILAPWLANAQRGSFDMLEETTDLADEMRWEGPYSGILVADLSGDELTFQAYHAETDVVLNNTTRIELLDHALWINGVKAEVNWDNGWW